MTMALDTRALNSAPFTAIILVGYGENLYPLNEGLNVPSKAFMPVGNVPILNHVLDWVLASGLTEILLLVPPSQHSSIFNHLTEYYSHLTHPRARINLLKHTEGEKDDEDLSSESAAGEVGGKKKMGTRREGTARLLRRFRNYIKTDFVLLPCDIHPPRNLTLSSILDKHLASSTSILTAVLYEPAPAVKESEEALLVTLDKDTKEMYMIRSVEALEEDLDARMTLLRSHPSVTFTTQYLDAHIYVFRRTVLDLISARRPKDLDSVREQIVPWLCKGSWQESLWKSWDQILNPPRRNIFSKALAYSISAPSGLEVPPDSPPGTPPSDETPRTVEKPPSPSSDVVPGSKQSSILDNEASSSRTPHWKCQAIIVAPETSEPAAPKGKDKSRAPASEPDYLIRVNSLAGYWELNRRLVRYLSSLHPSVRPSAGQKLDRTSASRSALSATAQISSDSVVGEGTQVGERASLKKCIVGRHCHIARGVKLTGCVVWDFVTIGENTRIENAILCSNVRIGDKATIKDCEFGPGFEAMPGVVLKGERLIAGQEA